MPEILPVTSPADLVPELREFSLLSDLSDEELLWLAQHGDLFVAEAGEILFEEGEPAAHMFLFLEGEMHGFRDASGEGGAVFIARKGDITGLLPYSRMTRYGGSGRAMSRSRALRIPSSDFPEMLRAIPQLGQRLVNVMSDRIRETARTDVHDDKLKALGKLAAGLAHELNNPAAAIRRAASSLRETFTVLRSNAEALLRAGLSADDFARLAKWSPPAGNTEQGTLERSDREEEIGDWLQQQGAADAWETAPALVDAGLNLEAVRDLAGRLPHDAVPPALAYLALRRQADALICEVEHAAGRISELVRSVKDYSFMDQAPKQEIDLHKGIENTLIMLGHKLKHGIEVERDYDRSLPRICAFASELNQVWTNLIDNAIDAMNGGGKLKIRTAVEGAYALIEVADNGPGIPKEIQGRVFEPFFTTKGVGEGTGLGLDIVRRIVRRHSGSVRFDSQPGNTRFYVRLPLIPEKEEQHGNNNNDMQSS